MRSKHVAAVCYALALFAVLLVSPLMASADPADRVTICHATGSQTNPYVSVTASGNGIYNGHIAHQHGNDIIPQFTIASGPHAGTYGPQGDQSILAAGCVVTQPSPSPSPSPSPTPGPTGPSGPTTPPPVPPDKPDKCEGAGADRPRCNIAPPVVKSPKGLAYTGASAETWVLVALAGALLMMGLWSFVTGRNKRYS